MVLWICSIFFLNYYVARLINAWEKARYERWDILRHKWRQARRRRECWLKRYEGIIPNARAHPEYVQLWEYEIGAEALYMIEIGSSLEISYADFKTEQRALQ